MGAGTDFVAPELLDVVVGLIIKQEVLKKGQQIAEMSATPQILKMALRSVSELSVAFFCGSRISRCTRYAF
jgi:hypothetical protein